MLKRLTPEEIKKYVTPNSVQCNLVSNQQKSHVRSAHMRRNKFTRKDIENALSTDLPGLESDEDRQRTQQQPHTNNDHEAANSTGIQQQPQLNV